MASGGAQQAGAEAEPSSSVRRKVTLRCFVSLLSPSQKPLLYFRALPITDVNKDSELFPMFQGLVPSMSLGIVSKPATCPCFCPCFYFVPASLPLCLVPDSFVPVLALLSCHLLAHVQWLLIGWGEKHSQWTYEDELLDYSEFRERKIGGAVCWKGGMDGATWHA